MFWSLNTGTFFDTAEGVSAEIVNTF